MLYLLMTLGPAAVILCVLDKGTPRILRPALVFGRVPLFYFLLHLPLIHLAALIVCYGRYRDVHWMFESARLDQFPMVRPVASFTDALNAGPPTRVYGNSFARSIPG